MTGNNHEAVYLKDYKPPEYSVEAVDLDFKLLDGRTVVKALTTFTACENCSGELFLNGEELELVSISMDGIELASDSDYVLTRDGIKIQCGDRKIFTLEIETNIYPENNTALEGLYISGGTYCTQCESEGFRKITYYPDRPDVMAKFRVKIEADKQRCPVLLSNGNKVESGEYDNGHHYAIWEDPFPKPSYLFALVAGDLEHIHDTFTTMSGREVDLYIYSRRGDADQCYHAMASLKKSMRWDEDRFGREYDLDLFNIVAISDFNSGAMENKSLNIFNTALVLAHPETATDLDFLRVEGVIAHEYFHNWTGNRITCRDWFQLSLKEGLTVYRDQEFSADMNSAPVQRIEDVIMLRRLQFPEDASPLAHPIRPDSYMEIRNFYTVTVYEKGAEVIRMMETILGADGFRKGMDLYFERHDGQAVTCMDFVQCMVDANNADLEQFRLWYEQAGTPEVHVKTFYDENSGQYKIKLRQRVPPTAGQEEKKPMHIPIKTALVNENGEDVLEQILHLKKEEQEFVFDNIGSKPYLSILRDFSAPIKLFTEQTDEELRFLMQNDSNGFNRWESGQKFALRAMNEMIDSYEQNGFAVKNPDLIDVFSEILNNAANDRGDKLLLAKEISLPDFHMISQCRKIIDPDSIRRVRDCLLKEISARNAQTIMEIYGQNKEEGEYSIAPESIAKRSLKNSALRLMCYNNECPSGDIAREQLLNATNMTDRIAALSVMVDFNHNDWEDYFAEFRVKYEDYPLVIDKWFALQASSVRDDTIDRVKKLRHHSDFTLENPNRIRSLFAAFAMNNPICFHHESGEGYKILGDVVIELNSVNPGIAARLLTPMRGWKQYTQDRQEKMQEILRVIIEQQDISKDVFEIARKSLG